MNDSIYHIVDSVSLASDTLVNPVGAASVLIEHPVELEWLVRPIYFDNIPHLGLLLLCLVVITLFLLARYRKANLFTLRNFFTIHDRSMAYEPETREWWGNVLMWVVTFCSYAIYLMLLLSIYSDQVLISDVRLGLIAIVAIGIYLLVHYLLFKLLNYIFSNTGSGNAYIQA